MGSNYPETPVSSLQPGFPKCLGRNPGISLHPELRIFKIRFLSEQRRIGKKDDVECCNSRVSNVMHEGLMGKLNEYDLPGGIPHTFALSGLPSPVMVY